MQKCIKNCIKTAATFYFIKKRLIKPAKLLIFLTQGFSVSLNTNLRSKNLPGVPGDPYTPYEPRLQEFSAKGRQILFK